MVGRFCLDSGCELHDILLGDFDSCIAANLTRDDSLAHHDNALADANDFGQFARDEKHGHALAGELLNHCVNLRLCSDIHAARGLVEDEHLGIDLQPTRQKQLLLVAARQPAGPNP